MKEMVLLLKGILKALAWIAIMVVVGFLFGDYPHEPMFWVGGLAVLVFWRTEK